MMMTLIIDALRQARDYVDEDDPICLCCDRELRRADLSHDDYCRAFEQMENLLSYVHSELFKTASPATLRDVCQKGRWHTSWLFCPNNGPTVSMDDNVWAAQETCLKWNLPLTASRMFCRFSDNIRADRQACIDRMIEIFEWKRREQNKSRTLMEGCYSFFDLAPERKT